MFDFDQPEDGSQDRFKKRMEKNPHPASKIRHIGWWLIHNVISHPLIGFFPFRWAFQFHDWTSRKLNSVPTSVAYRLKTWWKKKDIADQNWVICWITGVVTLIGIMIYKVII